MSMEIPQGSPGLWLPQKPGESRYDFHTIPIKAHRRAEGHSVVVLNDDYTATVLRGQSFLQYLPFLKKECKRLIKSALFWDEAAASGTMASIMTGVDPDDEKTVPSATLIHEKGSTKIIAISFQRELLLPAGYGKESTVYHNLRAVEPEHQKNGLAKDFIEIIAALYPEAKGYIHRSGNAAALFANTKSAFFDQVTCRPWGNQYTAGKLNLYKKESEEWGLVKEVDCLVGTTVGRLELTGVRRHAYLQQNSAFTLNPRHGGTAEIYDIMIRSKKEGGFGMNLPRGDAIYAYFRFNRNIKPRWRFS